MGLYLAVFKKEEEIAGVDVGGYVDFAAFRDMVASTLEAGEAGSRFPTLMLHPDSDGEWTSVEAAVLEMELEVIGQHFQQLPPISITGEWQVQVIRELGLQISTLYDCFFDVDGEPLVGRLIGLARLSKESNLPILFQ